MFILVAPALFAASIYMTLGRIIRSVNAEKYSLIRVNWLTKLFVLGDVMSFMIQGGSAGLMINSNTASAGEKMVVAGLLIQVVMFGLFIVVALLFQVRPLSSGLPPSPSSNPDKTNIPTLQSRMKSNPTPASYHPEIPWKQSLHMLYLVSLLIMIRSIFRVIEFVMGYDGYPLKHEWTLYVFDSVLMVFVTGVFYWRFPSELKGKGEMDGAEVAMA